MIYKRKFRRKPYDDKKVRGLKLLHKIQIAILLNTMKSTIALIKAQKYKKAGWSSGQIVGEVLPEIVKSYENLRMNIKENKPKVTKIDIKIPEGINFNIQELKDKLVGINEGLHISS